MESLIWIFGVICGFVACFIINGALAHYHYKKQYEMDLVRVVEALQADYNYKLSAYSQLRFHYDIARNLIRMLKELYYDGATITEREWQQVYTVSQNMPEWETPEENIVFEAANESE